MKAQDIHLTLNPDQILLSSNTVCIEQNRFGVFLLPEMLVSGAVFYVSKLLIIFIWEGYAFEFTTSLREKLRSFINVKMFYRLFRY